ncbi:hypothetical protein EDF46_1557 [Frondihabitans sp. PhB188]|uniref:endonuclease/exonuclease/phosphatase family protein n=1 Tax=Frondihabitans sp. PhB188 TaxID=2485200 RepID=UPI000F4ACFA9|nr:endonuclease/exonuclease/phosphatase family protein [Frondihabitans sp. PhB188]ROQ39922.1 hypothetical protein EDF46_1557 [Frondihabitans sp. PhB188]
MNNTESAGCTSSHRSSGTVSGYGILSYNLWKHRAADELEPLVDFESVDLLFLQEARTEQLPDSIGRLSSLVATSNGRLGLAVYGHSDRFVVEDARVDRLGRSVHDRMHGPTPHRLVSARLFDRFSGRRFVVGSFHASPLTAGNGLRRRQVRQAHTLLDSLGGGLPTLLIGDFNYPVGVGSLRRMLASTGHTLSLAADDTYRRFGVLRGRFDLVAARGLLVGPVRVLPRGKSDHLPIVATASFPS